MREHALKWKVCIKVRKGTPCEMLLRRFEPSYVFHCRLNHVREACALLLCSCACSTYS